MRRFALRRIAEIETERDRIARALHDDIGQPLLALNLGLYRLSQNCGDDPGLQEIIAGMRDLLGAISRAVRRLAADFRPVSTHAGDLQSLIASLIERFRTESGAHCVNTAFDSPELTREHAALLHRILLLALTGVARGRPACKPNIRIRRDGSLLDIVIRDEATGVCEGSLDPAEQPEIVELHEWLAALEGVVRTWEQEDGDTIVRIELPLP